MADFEKDPDALLPWETDPIHAVPMRQGQPIRPAIAAATAPRRWRFIAGRPGWVLVCTALAVVLAGGATVATVAFTSSPGTANSAPLPLPRGRASSSSGVSDGGQVNDSCGPELDAWQTTRRSGKDTTYLPGYGYVWLSYGRYPGYGWVAWATISDAAGGGSVVLRWSDSDGHDYHGCGPFAVATGRSSRLSWAVNQVPGRVFAACASNTHGSACTKWDSVP